MAEVETAAGRLFYLQRGTGQPIVAIHGAGGSSRHWGYQFSNLGKIARVIAPDLPGHGRSPGPPLGSIAEMAAAVLGLCDALELPQPIVMGHSMGGAVAQWLALHHPERVAGLVLMATGAQLPMAPTILEALRHDPQQAAALITRAAYGPAVEPQVLAQATAELQTVPPAVLLADYTACDHFDLTADASRITSRTLIVVGAHDSLTPPASARWLQQTITGSEFVELAGAGHMPMLEQPAAVNHLIDFWLST